MADPRKVPFVTLATYSSPAAISNNNNTTITAPPPPPQTDCKKRRREEDGEAAHTQHAAREGALTGGQASPAATAITTTTGSSAPSGLFSNGRSSGEPAPGPAVSTTTVRLTLALCEPGDKTFTEFNYTELLQNTTTTTQQQQQLQQVKKPPDVLTPALDPNDPLADKDQERLEVEALARKFESKYGCTGKKKKKDRMQDLIDIGYGYDESDSFIDNSEAYDELVPASLNTKLGGFYINTGTLQFRAASESEDEDIGKDGITFKLKDGEERAMKKRKKKQDGALEEKKPKKNRMPKPGVSALNRPEKKKRKKLMKDSLNLAAMLRRFSREKEEIRKKNLTTPTSFKPPNPTRTLNSHSLTPNNDLADLSNDPSVFPLLNSANDDVLQDLMGELDFTMLDPLDSSGQEGQGENGSVQRVGGALTNRVQRSSLIPPPPLPSGLSPPLLKRIEDLRTASRQFDMEGRKKFFTLDMNNILLDIELQVQEQPVEVRTAVYSHLEAFVPCNKEALMKRLKKLSLNVQDDRLRNPLLKLKLAVCSAMPEQIARYNMDCLAKVAKQQSEEGDRNGSEEEDEERPGKRVMGPRKKFVWDDKLRTLLCNLVRAKLCCYEVEGQNSSSPEDYLKAFMETEVKPLWPKGWMQARMLIKESRVAHSHLTGNTVKKRVVPTPKAKLKPQDGGWIQQSTLSTPTAASTPVSLPHRLPSPPEPICLSDSLDEDLGGGQSLDSISQALALLSSAAKGLIQPDGPVSPEAPKPSKPPSAASSVGPTSSVNSSPQIIKKTPIIAVSPVNSSPLIVSSSTPSSSPSLTISRPQHVHTSPAVRTDNLVGVKAATEVLAQRRVTTTTTPQRSVPMTLNVKPAAVSLPKPRPPPTASPLLPPQKGYNTPLSTPTSLHKPSNNSSVVRIGSVATTPVSQAHSPALSVSSTFSPSPSSTSASPHLNAKPQLKNSAPSPAPPKPQLKNSLPSPAPPKPHPQPQSTFVTPMQATLTKSPHSANSPILKLTPRVTPVSSPLPTLSRTTTLPSIHQYSSKSPGFHAGFSGVGSGYSTAVGQQKNPSQVNSTGLTSTSSSITKHASPVAGSTNHVQRQRPVSAANQGAKTLVSVSSASGPQLAQVSSAGGTLLASGAANLPLNFGMLGGLTPGSLSFTFPNLMSLPTVTGTSAAAATANQSSSGYSLQPNVNQNQSGDIKRKL